MCGLVAKGTRGRWKWSWGFQVPLPLGLPSLQRRLGASPSLLHVPWVREQSGPPHPELLEVFSCRQQLSGSGSGSVAVKICRATFGAAEAVPTGPEKQTQKRPMGHRVRAEPGCTQEEEGVTSF